MLRLIPFVTVVVVAALAGGCERDRLYEPCNRSQECDKEAFDVDGPEWRCIVSPYASEAEGFCTTDCEAHGPDLEPGQCVPNSACSTSQTEGCCYINYTQPYRGVGFCVPFPLQLPRDGA